MKSRKTRRSKVKLTKPFPKSVWEKMTQAECKFLNTLLKKYDKTGNDMLKYQALATQAMRKEGHIKPSSSVQRLINKGFQAEILAFKTADTLRHYEKKMIKKYTNV
jgi:hypothetical protein